MPKISSNSVIAKDKSTGLYERIFLTKETRLKFAKVGAPRYTKYPPPHTPFHHTPLSPEEWAVIRAEREEDYARQSLLSRLTIQKLKLEDRLSDPPVPLINRITAPSPDIHIPPPIPNTLHFRKTKILLRIEEFRPLLLATLVRLEPVFKILDKEDLNEDLGLAARVSPEVRDNIWGWFLQLQDINENLDTIGHKLTNAEWRGLKGALKKIGRVSFEEVKSRLPDICNELAELNITLP